jgi:hypothetical protein
MTSAEEPTDDELRAGLPLAPETASCAVAVKTNWGATLSYRMGSDDTVGDLKEHIREGEGVPVNGQMLIHAGKILANATRLAECAATDGATLHLVVRMRGD